MTATKKSGIKEALKGNLISVKSNLPRRDGDYLCVVSVGSSYRWKVVSYTTNLYKLDKEDFKNDRHPGWYSYEPGTGYYENNGVMFWTELPKTEEVLSEG